MCHQKRKNAKLQAFGFSSALGKSHFEDDETQNYLAFQPVSNCFKKPTAWKSNVLSEESIKPPAASVNSLAPSLK